MNGLDLLTNITDRICVDMPSDFMLCVINNFYLFIYINFIIKILALKLHAVCCKNEAMQKKHVSMLEALAAAVVAEFHKITKSATSGVGGMFSLPWRPMATGVKRLRSQNTFSFQVYLT